MEKFRLKAVVFALLLSLGTLGCAVPSGYYRWSLGGGPEPGMSQKEVKKELGEPAGFQRRQLSSDDLREIWVYHVQDFNLWTGHLYPKMHLIVFSNGVLLAKNPHDPYAPRNQF